MRKLTTSMICLLHSLVVAMKTRTIGCFHQVIFVPFSLVHHSILRFLFIFVYLLSLVNFTSEIHTLGINQTIRSQCVYNITHCLENTSCYIYLISSTITFIHRYKNIANVSSLHLYTSKLQS